MSVFKDGRRFWPLLRVRVRSSGPKCCSSTWNRAVRQSDVLFVVDVMSIDCGCFQVKTMQAIQRLQTRLSHRSRRRSLYPQKSNL